MSGFSLSNCVIRACSPVERGRTAGCVLAPSTDPGGGGDFLPGDSKPSSSSRRRQCSASARRSAIETVERPAPSRPSLALISSTVILGFSISNCLICICCLFERVMAGRIRQRPQEGEPAVYHTSPCRRPRAVASLDDAHRRCVHAIYRCEIPAGERDREPSGDILSTPKRQGRHRQRHTSSRDDLHQYR